MRLLYLSKYRIVQRRGSPAALWSKRSRVWDRSRLKRSLDIEVRRNGGPDSPDRGKQGTKRSLLVDGAGIPLGCVAAGANCHDSPLLAPTLEKLGRFGFNLPEQITVHLDAGYDSGKTRDLLATLGCDAVISTRGEPLQAGARWVVERTNSWHNHGFKKLLICTEKRLRVIDAFIALAAAIIITRRLIAEAWTRDRWNGRPTRQP